MDFYFGTIPILFHITFIPFALILNLKMNGRSVGFVFRRDAISGFPFFDFCIFGEIHLNCKQIIIKKSEEQYPPAKLSISVT